MDRNALILQLMEYGNLWIEESHKALQFIEFLSNHPDAFERSLPIGHVTGSAWLVNRAGSHVLLTHHKKLNIWVQLGGHADGDSDVLRVALREAKEESGLHAMELVMPQIFDIDVHLIPARQAEPSHYHWDVRYAFRVVGGESFTPTEESHELRWIEIARLDSVTHEESMLRMARKWLHEAAGATRL